MKLIRDVTPERPYLLRSRLPMVQITTQLASVVQYANISPSVFNSVAQIVQAVSCDALKSQKHSSLIFDHLK